MTKTDAGVAEVVPIELEAFMDAIAERNGSSGNGPADG